MAASSPVNLAVVNDHELIVRGVAAILAPHSDRIRVLELDSDVPVSQPVDVALYDAFTHTALSDSNLRKIIDDDQVGKVVVYTWILDEGLIQTARELGVAASVPKTLSGKELADAIVEIHAGDGELITIEVEEPCTVTQYWPGYEFGLTPREAEVIALITDGLSNQQIAERTHLSINSIKFYIRSAYRTMGVTSRSQAVLWGVDHNMRPRTTRVLNPAR